MERWNNCVAVVTGASSGIGVAIVKDFLAAGLKVVGVARRKELMDQLKEELPIEQKQRFSSFKCDVGCPESVKEVFETIIRDFGGIDILINNAGMAQLGQLTLMDESVILQTLKVNVMGVVSCTRYAFQSMKERSFNGHIVIINSILGHTIPSISSPPVMNIYPPSKYAVTALTEMYRQEFVGLDTNIKITSISPGMTDTPIVPESFKENRKILQPEDVSNCVMFAISTPEHVQIHEIIVQPNGKK